MCRVNVRLRTTTETSSRAEHLETAPCRFLLTQALSQLQSARGPFLSIVSFHSLKSGPLGAPNGVYRMLFSKMSRLPIVTCLLLALTHAFGLASACRVSSELLKSYTRDTIESLLDVQQFQSLYWPDEPLGASALTKATGINVTLVETHFQVDGLQAENEIAVGEGNSSTRHANAAPGVVSLIQDVFVTCSVGRDRSYALSINLELDNPFKTIDFHYDLPHSLRLASGKTRGRFRIGLPQSSLLVQLSQRIRYDECLTINNVQLAPSVSYEIECNTCDDQERAHLDTALNKRMSQFDAELDAAISEKLLFGLQVLLNQQRLELD